MIPLAMVGAPAPGAPRRGRGMREVSPRWRVAVLLCTNDRGGDSPKASCGPTRGRDLRRWLRDRARDAGLLDDLLVSTSGCLGVCSPAGHTVVLIDRAGPRAVVVVESDADHEALWERVVAVVGGAPGRPVP